MTPNSKIADLLRNREGDLLETWLREQLSAATFRPDLLSENELRRQTQEFLTLLKEALAVATPGNISGDAWKPVRDFLTSLARTRAQQGFNFAEVATFVFSFKQPLFETLQDAYGDDVDTLTQELWTATTLVDKLGLFSTESFIKNRDDIISRQRQEMLELSTPVVKLWEGILALPLIGTLDSERTQVVMENLLQKIVDTGATTAIIDITGVPTVDTLVAQHLLKTVAAAQLMGAECIISGIRPQIAQTIIHLGIDLSGIITKASLADAFLMALDKAGQRIVSAAVSR